MSADGRSSSSGRRQVSSQRQTPSPQTRVRTRLNDDDDAAAGGGSGGTLDLAESDQVNPAMSPMVSKNAARSAISAAARATGATAIGVPQQLLDDFSKQYQILVYDATTVEQSAKDIRRIVDANFAVYKLLSSFLEAVRAYSVSRGATNGPGGSSTFDQNAAIVSVHDLDALENERELRLLRSIVASNAETVGLGNSFLASIDPANLKRNIVDALNTVAAKGGGAGGGAGGGGGGSGEEGDDTAEEKRPESVNLDDNGGLYAIRPTDDAISLERLIGYQNEAREIVSFCRRVEFVQAPVAGGGASDQSNSDDAKKKAAESAPRNPVVVILYGPPGTGKTTIAQSVAKYLDCIFMYVNAENVTSQWAGGTEKNIAKLFRRARIASVKLSPDPGSPRPVLLLIDEIDGLVKNRATSTNLTGEEYNRITTFLQMLTPPIGVNNSNIICIFTTNRLDNIDSAIVNRARGQIFMGYVTSPQDRVSLVDQVFRDYVNGSIGSSNSVRSAAIKNDDLVPRDLQNILSRAKNSILARYVERSSGGGGGGTSGSANAAAARLNVVINLSDAQNRVSLDDLAALLNEASPGTNARVLFRDYSPPLAHVCRWLVDNRPYLNVCRSASEYKAHGKECGSS